MAKRRKPAFVMQPMARGYFTPNQLAVEHAIRGRVDPALGYAFPSLAQIGIDARMERRTVIRVVKQLEEEGSLRKQGYAVNGRQTANRYWVPLWDSKRRTFRWPDSAPEPKSD